MQSQNDSRGVHSSHKDTYLNLKTPAQSIRNAPGGGKVDDQNCKSEPNPFVVVQRLEEGVRPGHAHGKEEHNDQQDDGRAVKAEFLAGFRQGAFAVCL